MIFYFFSSGGGVIAGGIGAASGFAPLSIADGVVLGDICEGAGAVVVGGTIVVSFFSQALNANIDNIAVATKVSFMVFLF
jgi:hypothetical protein